MDSASMQKKTDRESHVVQSLLNRKREEKERGRTKKQQEKKKEKQKKQKKKKKENEPGSRKIKNAHQKDERARVAVRSDMRSSIWIHYMLVVHFSFSLLKRFHRLPVMLFE